MRRLLALLLLAAALVLGRSPAIAGACSCAEPTPTDSAERADAVFAGTVTDARSEFPEDSPDDAVDRTIYTFAVDRVYEGEVAETVEVVSGADSAACGAVFDEGRHLVYATVDEHSGDLRTTLCSGNQALDDEGAGVPAVLGDGVAPAAAPGTGDDRATADEQEAGGPSTTWPPIGGPEGDVIDPGFLDTYGPALAVLAGVAVLGTAGTWVLVRRRRSA